MNFYLSVFEDGKVLNLSRYPAGAPLPEGTLMTAGFVLNGQEFVALNGGPAFGFNQAISFVVNCDTQDEVDYYWDKLSEGGRPNQCGWLADRFRVLASRTDRPGPPARRPLSAKAARAMQAMLPMAKIDIAALERAAAAA